MIQLDSPVKTLPGVGEAVLEKLRRLKIKKVRDLLFHLPFRYDDFSNIKKIADLAVDEKATVAAKILNIANKRTWKRKMNITEALLEDESAPIMATWFNQPYLTQTLKKGLWVNVSGKVSAGKMGLYFSNPVFEVLGPEPHDRETLHTGGLAAVYPETQGLSSRWLRFKIKTVLDNIGPIEDFLPEFIKKEFNLAPLSKALKQIHFPKTAAEAEAAKRRFSFQDIFLIQLFTYGEKQKVKSRLSVNIPIDVGLIKKFTAGLPFKLTDSQKIAAWQILKDMEKPSPMNRLLVGDVGSGKTVVAAMAALNAAGKNYQSAFLAPTEILANQHFQTLAKLFSGWPVEVGLLTSATSKLSRLNLDNYQIVVGTHALIQKNVVFSNLALVVVDEQHRFGVEQRAALLRGSTRKETRINAENISENPRLDPRESAHIPHLLSMSATPIPRTLALTLYGDLDLSTLKELPRGRKKIITKVVSPINRDKAYQFIENQIRQGRQIFVICPRIDAEETQINADKNFSVNQRLDPRRSAWADVRAATEEYEKLSRHIFPHRKIGLLHGRLKAAEKEAVMTDFKNKKTDILVSTSVVEVGVDVPNASVMMIEGADRFGLAQLHQFRGRVGRAEHQSYCFLFTQPFYKRAGFTESATKATTDRLKILAESEDGFKLAEKDLQIRGPGQFLGKEQSGLPDLAMSSLKDTKLIEEVQQAVKLFFEKSNPGDHLLIEQKLSEFKREIHWA